MKKVKKLSTSRLVSAAMALLLIFTVFASFGAIKANAVVGYVPPSDGDGVIDVYYLFDYYPEVGNTKMANEHPDIDIVYDRCNNIENTLIGIADGSYLPGNVLPEGATVVIDIKTYQPESAILAAAFGYIKDNLHCKVVFVTVYNEADFTDDDPENSFHDYIDDFYKSTHQRLEAFCDFSTQDVESTNVTLNDTCILIDGNLVDLNSSLDNSTFLRALLEKLCFYVGMTFDSTSSSASIISTLKEDYNISLLVSTLGPAFKDLATGHTHYVSNVTHPEGNGLEYSNIYAIGFNRLEPYFLDYLYHNYFNNNEITQYLLEADPLVPHENGVPVILDYYPEQTYNDGSYDLDDFMQRLMGVVES